MYNYDEIKAKIKGPVFSIVTPFKTDDSIDFDSLEKYIEYAYKQGATNFYVMGYNSRYSELSWDEIKDLNAFVTKKVKGLSSDNLMIVADPLHCSTKVSLDFAKHAEEIGADVISIICREKYYSDDQVFAHYEYIANNSDIGILVHEMPFLNGYGGPAVNWPLSLLTRVCKLKNVVAVKEDAKDDAYSKEVIAAIKDDVSIVISGGGVRQWLRFADDGCQSWLNGFGVFEPKLEVNFWKAYQQGNKEVLDRIVNEIEVPFFENGVKKLSWHLTIKAALEARGLMNRHERLPMLALKDEDAQKVNNLLNELPIEELMKDF